MLKLTDAYWLDRECDRVEGILAQQLGHASVTVAEALELLDEYGLHYTQEELVAIRDELVARGVIEIV